MYTDLNKVYCKCSNCGQVAEVDASAVLTSDPPKYNYHCPHCNNSGYVLCSEVFSDSKATSISPSINSLKDAPIEICGVTSCLICGAHIKVSMWENHSKICDKCKKAVLKLRKMLEDKEND